VNDDGLMDLVSHYATEETGIAPGDMEAFPTRQALDGIPSRDVTTSGPCPFVGPGSSRRYCGLDCRGCAREGARVSGRLIAGNSIDNHTQLCCTKNNSVRNPERQNKTFSWETTRGATSQY
jgi:hypothetical protein